MSEEQTEVRPVRLAYGDHGLTGPGQRHSEDVRETMIHKIRARGNDSAHPTSVNAPG